MGAERRTNGQTGCCYCCCFPGKRHQTSKKKPSSFPARPVSRDMKEGKIRTFVLFFFSFADWSLFLSPFSLAPSLFLCLSRRSRSLPPPTALNLGQGSLTDEDGTAKNMWEERREEKWKRGGGRRKKVSLFVVCGRRKRGLGRKWNERREEGEQESSPPSSSSSSSSMQPPSLPSSPFLPSPSVQGEEEEGEK